MPTMLGFIQNISAWQWLILLAVGLLIFGRRLPEIGRNLGKSIVEFKKGLKDIEHEIEDASRRDAEKKPQIPEKSENDSRRVSTSDVVEEQPQSS